MRPTVCYVASYDPLYSRNVDTVRAIRRAGVRVELIQGASGPTQRFSRRTKIAKFSAVPRMALGTLVRTFDVTVRLVRCRALIVGYFGQLDMILLGPIARLMGRPVIFNPLVTLTDTIVEDRKLVSAASPFAWLIRRFDRWSLRLADLVFADTRENADYIARIAGLDPTRILVMPVGVDETVFYPDVEGREREPGCLDVIFYGTFIPLHGIETIIRSASILRDRGDIRFELIGTGQDYASARELANSLGLINIRWTDWLPYSGLGDRLREADVALGVFDGGEKAGRVIPNKVHQALACGVPVVTRTGSAAERFLRDQVSAILVPPDDPQSLSDALESLASDPARRRRIGERGRAAWQRHASEPRLVSIADEALRRTGVMQ